MSGLLLAPLAVAGCPSDDTGQEGTQTTSDDTTSSTGSSTAMVDSSSSESSTGEPATGCQVERPVPEPPAAAADCSGATMTYEGNIFLEEGGQDTVDLLVGVREITGALRINRQSFENLDFMACVQVVGRDLNIFGNEQLTNVDGLYNLTSVESFVFSQNDAIEDFNGLPLLEQIDGSVVFSNNASLRTITGFHSFVGLNGMGTKMGEVIGGNLTIQENPVLESIDGFGQIRVVNGRVQITNNPELCISSVMCVVEGIVQPAEPPDSWSTVGNNGGC